MAPPSCLGSDFDPGRSCLNGCDKLKNWVGCFLSHCREGRSAKWSADPNIFKLRNAVDCVFCFCITTILWNEYRLHGCREDKQPNTSAFMGMPSSRLSWFHYTVISSQNAKFTNAIVIKNMLHIFSWYESIPWMHQQPKNLTNEANVDEGWGHWPDITQSPLMVCHTP